MDTSTGTDVKVSAERQIGQVGQEQKEMYMGDLFNNPRLMTVKISPEAEREYRKYGEQMYGFDFVGTGDDKTKGTETLSVETKKKTKESRRSKLKKKLTKEDSDKNPNIDPVADSVANIMVYLRSGLDISDLSKEEQDMLRGYFGSSWKETIQEELEKEPETDLV